MNFVEGVYENLINKEIEQKKNESQERVFLENDLDSAEHPRMLADYLSKIIKRKLEDDNLSSNERIAFANRILEDVVEGEEILIDTDKYLAAVVSEQDNARLQATGTEIIRPLTGFRLSNLFTGRQSPIPLNEEISRDIKSADTIYMIVSFLKLSGVRLILEALKEETVRKTVSC